MKTHRHMRHIKLVTQIVIVLMVSVVATPDLFHHVPMPLDHPTTAGESSHHDSSNAHDPVACSILHAGHGCHLTMQPQLIDSTNSDAPEDSIGPWDRPFHLAAMAADIFHPPVT